MTRWQNTISQTVINNLKMPMGSSRYAEVGRDTEKGEDRPTGMIRLDHRFRRAKSRSLGVGPGHPRPHQFTESELFNADRGSASIAATMFRDPQIATSLYRQNTNVIELDKPEPAQYRMTRTL
jgi:hypothetical protein